MGGAKSTVVAIVPPESLQFHDVARTSLSSLVWPTGRPKRLLGGTVADMLPSDHLVLMPRNWFWYRRFSGIQAQVSLAIPEPRAWERQHYILAKFFHKRFRNILVADTRLIDSIPNGLMVPFGTTWVPDWETRDLTKDKNLSLIASAKKRLKGHKMRHKCVKWMRAKGTDVDVMGGGYQRFDVKADGLARYRFSVVIENSREENYFTEKIIDALLCRTVPIYWGCPNIGDYFDTSGMIVCEDMESLQQAIATVNEQEYEKRLKVIEANRTIASTYIDYYGRIAQKIREAE